MTVTSPFFTPSELDLARKEPDAKGQGDLVPRDGYGRPMIVPMCGGNPTAHTRVTTHIDCLDDKSALTDYLKRNVLVGAAKDAGLVERVLRLVSTPESMDDPEVKRTLNTLAKEAEATAGANRKSEKGTHLHLLSEYVDRGEPLPPCSADDAADMEAYRAATERMQPVHIERLVVNPELRVAGTPDRLSLYDGLDPDGQPAGHVITDLKTGRVDYGSLKFAMQLAIYSRSMFYDHTLFPAPDPSDKKAWAAWKRREVPAVEAVKAYTPIGEVNQGWGIIIALRPGSAKADLYWVDLQAGWEAACTATEVRRLRGKKDVMIPVAA